METGYAPALTFSRKTEDYIRTKSDQVAYDKGYRIDFDEVDRVIQFFREYLRHSKGKFAGEPFEFAEWQLLDIVIPVFGWTNTETGMRRFKTAYIEVPKKNGKSTMCAGFALYLLCGDGENGSEVYCCAGDRKQASIVFNEAVEMVKASPDLSRYIDIRNSRKWMSFDATRSTLEALSAEAYTKEGFNVHGLIFDELHTQPNRKLVDTFRYAGAMRDQPLTVYITTAGDDLESVGYEEHTYAEKIIDPDSGVVDIHYFAYIRATTVEDDPFSEETWKKANPGYGITIRPDEMEQAANEAKNKPTLLNAFLRYRLNIWCRDAIRWITPDMWKKNINSDRPEPGPGARCYAGVDLSSTTDVAGFVCLFPETLVVKPYLYVPAATVENRRRTKRQLYDYWIEKGWLFVTDGEVIDYKYIVDQMKALRGEEDGDGWVFERVGCDPYNGTQFAQDLLREDFEVDFVRQGIVTLNEPTKFLDRCFRSGALAHFDHPVLRWMAGNCVIVTDSANNMKIDKKKSNECIDGMAALVNAARMYMVYENWEGVEPGIHIPQ